MTTNESYLLRALEILKETLSGIPPQYRPDFGRLEGYLQGGIEVERWQSEGKEKE